MRSTSLTMRSASSQIRRVSARSSLSTDGFEQLRRAADAGKRVLDLVGEHRGQPGHGARGAAMGELAVDLVRHGALLEHDDDVSCALDAGRGIDVDDALAAVSRRADDRRGIR